MKKFLFVLISLFMCCSINAHIFDGIDLNANKIAVTRSISLRGYVNDPETSKLKGECHGTVIYLDFDFENSIVHDKIGRMFVEIPMSDENALQSAASIFNVIYHQVNSNDGLLTYKVSDDGTLLKLDKISNGIKLIYVTPFFKEK